MSMTYQDLEERLKHLDELTLLELLDLSSEEIVDRFGDLIEDRFDELEQFFEEEETDDDWE